MTDTIKYYYVGNKRIAMRRAGTLYYMFSDHLGSTSVTLNATTGATTTAAFLPFGGIRSSSGSMQTDRLFTGQTMDSSSGLYYYGARYYDSDLGRFLSPDTIVQQPGNPQSLNRFSYAFNNPLRYIDPTGYFSEDYLRGQFGDNVVDEWKQDSIWWSMLSAAEDGDYLLTLDDEPGAHFITEDGRLMVRGTYGTRTVGSFRDSTLHSLWRRNGLYTMGMVWQSALGYQLRRLEENQGRTYLKASSVGPPTYPPPPPRPAHYVPYLMLDGVMVVALVVGVTSSSPFLISSMALIGTGAGVAYFVGQIIDDDYPSYEGAAFTLTTMAAGNMLPGPGISLANGSPVRPGPIQVTTPYNTTVDLWNYSKSVEYHRGYW